MRSELPVAKSRAAAQEEEAQEEEETDEDHKEDNTGESVECSIASTQRAAPRLRAQRPDATTSAGHVLVHGHQKRRFEFAKGSHGFRR